MNGSNAWELSSSQVLGSYINPGGHIPKDFFGEDKEQDGGVGSSTTTAYTPPSEKWLLPEVVSELLSQSCLIPAMSSYLRNDSVLDMARHVPLYRALLQLLRGGCLWGCFSLKLVTAS